MSFISIIELDVWFKLCSSVFKDLFNLDSIALILLINNFALNGFQMDQERQWEEEEERKRMQYFKKQNVQDAKQTIHKLKQKYLKRYPLGTPFKG